MNASGDWWLRVNNVWVGYWPASLFSAPGLRDGGDRAAYSGEIIDHENGNLHTSTDMGSGHFPGDGFSYAAYQKNLL
jgi:hypothetical protein